MNCSKHLSGAWKSGSHRDNSRNRFREEGMNFTAKTVSFSLLFFATAGLLCPSAIDAQTRKMTVGQAGVNPGAGLFSIAVNQGYYKKHGLDVEIIKTNTTAAVQAMLASKMQMATGAGAAAFVTATLEGAPQPFVLIAERRGYEMLLALPGLGIPWQQNGEIVPVSYLKSNRDNVVRLMRATAEASKFYFEQKEKTIDIMMEYLGRPRDETEYAYNQYRRWTDRVPRPQVDTIRTTLEAIKKSTPKAATANPASFIDTSIVDQLVKEGYYK